MRFKCNSCQRDLNIPDSKLPDAPKFKVKCPHCRKEIVVNRAEKGQDLGGEAMGKSGSVPYSTIEPEVFPPGASVAFLLISDKRWSEAAQNGLKQAEYYISQARGPEEAVLKLRLNEYDLVMVEDTPANQVVIEEIGTWTGLRRRSLNFILIGDEAASLDPQIAFRKAINSYLNINDAGRAETLMDNVIKGYGVYYRWFAQVQEVFS
ncbi:zinc-ribbon domain-containing protein [Oceanidesulfovibrio marinus]|uniref:Zinc finger/thioredoxin putative domain-containing protein n=1 Tax=Oceanidesulfovibrio marinus TaxID=370038 RepID=A0A6P1ZGJ0_9BACT|nr:zinc-ribbon domain-containing protein [Oceanidesulfovibrio marinus]QJT08589.1 hypothetical protein E8L03_06480 [Oceanidesulfovibrio marinus]TVM32577.1 hypothetical protein DQK91_14990 [Oceanidesulfovibrio marinus]